MHSDKIKAMYAQAKSLTTQGKIYAHIAQEGLGQGRFEVKELTEDFIVCLHSDMGLVCPLESVRAFFVGEFEGEILPYTPSPASN